MLHDHLFLSAASRPEQGPLRGPAKDGGFTMIEVLVALFLGMVVVGAVLSFHTFQLRALSDQAVQVDIQSTARGVVDLFAREIRRAGRPPTTVPPDPGHCGLVSAEPHKLAIVSPDGAAIYHFTSHSVTRRAAAADNLQAATEEVLIEDVDTAGSAFVYLDANGNTITPGTTAALLNQVRRIQIQISLTGRNELRGRAATNVTLRNRFFQGATSVPACI